MDNRMKLYGEIIKVEAQEDGSIRVSGVASTGAVDDADERVLPEAMKAALPAYMRFGALREMHGLAAAGATLHAEVDEAGATRIEALVVDPVAVRKVQHGVYKGFSIGGKVLARDPDDRRVITKLKLNEISLVDRPCNPEAVIDMWKAGGGRTPTNAEVIARASAMAAAAGRPGRHTEFVVKAREALVQEAGADELDEGDAETTAPEADAAIDGGGDDRSHIQAAHDALVQAGARCQADNCADTADGGSEAAGAKAWRGDELRKARTENARLTREVEAIGPHIEILHRTIETLERRLEELAAQPMPPKTMAGAVRAVTKAEDVSPTGLSSLSAEELKKYFDALPAEERGQIQLRAALRQPFAIGR
jgi:hypothetical protein